MHVHLMVEDAIVAAQIDQFAEAGADVITVHAECASVATGALARIKPGAAEIAANPRARSAVMRVAQRTEA